MNEGGLIKHRVGVLEQLVRDGQTGFAIDPDPADNGECKTQTGWIAFFNKQGKPMISAADLYSAAKLYIDGKFAPNEALQSLKRDFDESWLLTSTRIIYSDIDLSGKITQNYGSKVVKPSQTYIPVIPFYNNASLAQALQTEKGVVYLQALFGTNDDPETIASTLEILSDRKPERIGLWAPNRDSRRKYPERAVGLGIDGNWFHVDGDYIVKSSYGLSRGVSASPLSGGAKNKIS